MCDRSDGVIFFSELLYNFIAAESSFQSLEELFDLWVEVISDVFVFLHRFLEAQDGDSVIPVQLKLGFSDAVLEESSAIVILIENFDVAGDEL